MTSHAAKRMVEKKSQGDIFTVARIIAISVPVYFDQILAFA